MSDSSAIYTVVYGDALLGTLLYSYSLTTLTGIKSGKIALATALSRYVEIQPCLYGTLNMLIPILQNIWVSASTNQDILYLVQVVRLTLTSVN